MKKSLISALAACAVLAMPAYALADAMPGHDAMSHDAMAHAMSGTMICRPATAKEHPTGMLMDGKSPIVCKTVDAAMMMSGKGGPDLSKALTSAQVDAAWRSYVAAMISVPGGDGGG